MKKMLLFIIVFLFSASLYAQTNVKFDAQVRPRAEFDNRDFNNDLDGQTYTTLRSRLGAMFSNGKDVEAYLQIQDSRVFGTEPSTLANTQNVDIHQAYFKVKDLFGLPVDIKGGRMEVAYGTQRLVGAVDWSYIGRSFDGGMVKVKADNFYIDVFSYHVDENNQPGDTLDVDFSGIHSAFMLGESVNIQPYVYWQHRVPAERLNRFTIGALLQADVNNFNTDVEIAYQTGEMTDNFNNQIDINAYMLAANVKYNFDSRYKPYLGAGIAVLSGDDNVIDDETNAFNTMYATNHKFYGFMDFFNPNNAGTIDPGLMDIHVKGGIQPFSKFSMALAFHIFNSMEDYIVPTGETETSYGSEVDLILGYNYNENLDFTAGASVFNAGEIYEATRGTGNANWFYFMTKVSF